MQLGNAPLPPQLQPAPASLVLQRRGSVAQGCLGVQRSLGDLWLRGGSARHPESRISGSGRARGKGDCSHGAGTWREGTVLVTVPHTVQVQGGLSLGQDMCRGLRGAGGHMALGVRGCAQGARSRWGLSCVLWAAAGTAWGPQPFSGG